MKKRLTRSTTDRYVAGVLGGVSEYFNIDSKVVRITFILVSFFTANIPTFTMYILLALFMPKDTDVLDNY